jgi:cytochrome c-type biogenesis protein CcsB
MEFNSFSDTAKKNIGFLGYLNMVGTKQKRKTLINKLIGSITAPSALFTNAFATFSLPKEMQESSPLVPALQSNWLMMHVTVMILSYAALILGSLLSIGFLVISSGKSSETTNNLIILNETSKSPKFIIGETQLTLDLNLSTWEQPNSPSSVSNYSSVGTQVKENNRLNLAKTLDNLSYRILGLGFPLLTIGILSGAVWANEAWGSYWSWDPKETWALLTWLVFAIYLHTRLTKGWEGKKPALIASLGFVTVWICFLGVNLIGEGLHSYGWVS